MTIQQALITLAAAVISGVLATAITIAVNAYHERIRLKQALVDDLFGYKYQLSNQNSNIDMYSQGFSRAMNRVPIIFDKDNSVLDAYDRFYDTLSMD